MMMNRTLANSFHEQLDSIKSTSLPQMKHFIQKRIAKCKIPTINRMMKRSLIIGYSSKNNVAKHNESDYEFGWGSDFDDDDDDQDFVVDDDIVMDDDELSDPNQDDDLQFNDENGKEKIQNTSLRQTKRPISDPPPPPLPKCPPPDLIEETTIPSNSDTNSYETLSITTTIMDNCLPRIDKNDYLIPNISSSSLKSFDKIKLNYRSSPNISSVTDRPLPPIPKYEYNLMNDDDEMFKNYQWFQDIERDDAENLLIRHYNIDGAFLVRKSKRAGICMPYTLTLYFNHRIFHLNIRIRSDQQYALGTEKLREKTFQTIADLIEHHYQEPIYLTSRGMIAGKTTLISMPFGYQ
uniref:B-cell linker protein-like n=1 Tax=Dermatophagoides pteronyssinus TaxID=6956 RepID=A0A6P6Y9P9_DERPT|nr:B-cell linker protein-like [Dermatophagoides pteronyssinus]